MDKLTPARNSIGDRPFKNLPFKAAAMPLIITLAGIMLTGCASPLNQANKSRQSMDLATEEMVVAQAEQPELLPSNTTSIPKPQLIKTARVELVTDSVDDAIAAINKIVDFQQGDILNLNDYQPTSRGARRSANMQIRVPQQQLEVVMAQIADLGEVRSSSISTEDVSNQLVDLQARLVNLRRTEASFLEIMERSGSVSEVLKVAQELSQTREQIERIDAQLQSLQTRVAYSTIAISIEASVTAAEPGGVPLPYQLKESWSNAIQSFASFTTGIIKFLIWLLVYSPYFLAIGLGIWLIRRFGRGKALQQVGMAVADPENPTTPGKNQPGVNQSEVTSANQNNQPSDRPDKGEQSGNSISSNDER